MLDFESCRVQWAREGFHRGPHEAAWWLAGSAGWYAERERSAVRARQLAAFARVVAELRADDARARRVSAWNALVRTLAL